MQAAEERKQKKQQRKADEGHLAVKRQEMDKAKVSLVLSLSSRESSSPPESSIPMEDILSVFVVALCICAGAAVGNTRPRVQC